MLLQCQVAEWAAVCQEWVDTKPTISFKKKIFSLRINSTHKSPHMFYHVRAFFMSYSFLFLGEKNEQPPSQTTFIRYDSLLTSLWQSSSLNFLAARICRIALRKIVEIFKFYPLNSKTLPFNGICSIGLTINESC